jgi:nicotinamidase-related amidase
MEMLEDSEKTRNTFWSAPEIAKSDRQNLLPSKHPPEIHALTRWLLACVATIPILLSSSASGAPVPLSLDLKTRNSSGQVSVNRQSFLTSELAILVIDVWDSHPDPEMASRISALIPRMNQTLDAARRLGIPVIFCPNEVPLPKGADTNIFKTLPNQPQINNGFNPPAAPYSKSAWGDMVPISYDAAHHPRFAHWTRQHPDLIVRPGDLASLSRQQIYNYCVSRGITRLLYMGAAENMCLYNTREISMVPMKRYCGIESIMVRDLTSAMSLNNRKTTGNNNSASNLDPDMTPDYGDDDTTAFNETYVCSTITSRQLLQYQWSAGYDNLVSGNTQLLYYWRMGSRSGYQEIVDVRRGQSCWWNRNDSAQVAGLSLGIPGAIINDPSTAIGFKGSTTLLISPLYRVGIPSDSDLASLSGGNFSVEMWVRVDQLNNSNQWFFAHDDGTPDGVDVLLGLNSTGHFQFIVGHNPTGTGIGDRVESEYAVTQNDVDSRRWFYIVAAHDRTNGRVELSINANETVVATENCSPVNLLAAPHFGSRGETQMGANGYLSNRGFEYFNGALDQVGIYSSSLAASTITAHYAAALQVAGYAPPQIVAEQFENDGSVHLSVRGSSGSLYILEASTNLNNWTALNTNLATTATIELYDSSAAAFPARFYRVLEIP